MAKTKNYRSATGVDEFYYAVLNEQDTVTAEIERVRFLQEITVDMPQEIVRAYGDNTTAEMGVSSGDIGVTSQFHTVPIEDKTTLLGWEESESGIVATGSDDNPPYVAVIFARTYQDGSREYVGLPKGMFTRPSVEGRTKEENIDFSSETIEAQFMDRKIEGFAKDRSVAFAHDDKDSTTKRDDLFQMIFGKPHPDAVVVPEP